MKGIGTWFYVFESKEVDVLEVVLVGNNQQLEYVYSFGELILKHKGPRIFLGIW